jgi:hypothetical protein
VEATAADRKSRLLFVVAIVGVLLAVLALGWFTFVGTSNSRPGAIEATCNGGVASTFDPPHQTFKWFLMCRPRCTEPSKPTTDCSEPIATRSSPTAAIASR